MTRMVLLGVLLALLTACGGDQEDDDKPDAAVSARDTQLPDDLCTWVPKADLKDLVRGKPTSDEVRGVPTSICTAVSEDGSNRSITVILKRFKGDDAVTRAQGDLTTGCDSFAGLAPDKAPSDGDDSCARTGDNRAYVLTLPNPDGDTLLVGIGGLVADEALAQATRISKAVGARLAA